MKLFRKIWTAITWPFRKIHRRIMLAKMYVKLEAAFEEKVLERKKLRAHINRFLHDFFGIDAVSKYIPHDFKNKEEVKVAVIDKFGKKMDRLGLTYKDLFSK